MNVAGRRQRTPFPQTPTRSSACCATHHYQQPGIPYRVCLHLELLDTTVIEQQRSDLSISRLVVSDAYDLAIG